MSRSLQSTAVLAVLALAACGTDLGGDVGVDGDSIDVALGDTGAAVTDTGVEDRDAGGDGPADTTPVDTGDAGRDVVEDSAAETGGDAEADVPSDTGSDATPDSDTATDTGEPDGAALPEGGVCDLLENPGAESGDLAGWSVATGSFFAVTGSALGGRPDAFAGSRSFAAGTDAMSELTQRVDVSEWSSDIDLGGVDAVLSAAVRTWSGDDEAALVVRALDAEGNTVSEVPGGPWTADTWVTRTVVMELPPGVRTIEVALRGMRRVGTDNDAYFDAVSLCVGGGAPGPALTAPPYLMWVTEDAVSVRWETREAVVGSVEVDLPEGGTEAWSETSARTTHEIRVEGLSPATTYGYRIAWPGGSSETYSFRSAPAPDSDAAVSFVVWGDNQDGPARFSAMTPRMAALDPDFAMSTGDCVQNGTRGEYRSQLFGPIAPLASGVPFLVAAGNHERYGDSGAALFEEYMSQPGDEHCFGWRYGPLYILFVDTEESIDAGSAQHACITTALGSEAARTARFRAAAFHKPPRIDFWFGGLLAFTREMEAPWVRETLEPLLESLDVDVVFNGHNHQYAYSPETDGGITWFTTGGAGGMLDTDSFLWRVGDWPEIAVQIHEHHFLHVAVDGENMTVRALAEDGTVLDSRVVVADPS